MLIDQMVPLNYTKAFHQIARFDVHTLPNDHHVMLNKVSYWTKWGEYVNTQRLSNSS